MQKLFALTALTLLLVGCIEDKGAAYAECTLNRSQASQNLPSPRDYQQSLAQVHALDRQFALCMRAKGFESTTRCGIESAVIEQCYRPVGTVKAIIDDLLVRWAQ